MRVVSLVIVAFTVAACAPWLPRSAALHAQTAGVGAGIQFVRIDIVPGTYRSGGGGVCYWERLRGFSGLPSDVIGSGSPVGPAIVTIAMTDEALRSFGCGAWTLAVAPVTASPTAPFGDGTFQVGLDIAPGTWQSPGGPACHWARLAAFSGVAGDVIGSGNPTGPVRVTIDSGDVGFVSQYCGMWTNGG